MSAVQVFEQLQQHAIAHSNDEAIVIPPLVPGQWVAQGDVNFIALPQVPEDAVKAEPVSQLAPGNSRGSRHCIAIADMPKVKFWKLPYPNEIQGLILEFVGDVRVEHPEHGDQCWSAGAIVLVSFQRKHAEELRRVED
jgi:hypothetical protein